MTTPKHNAVLKHALPLRSVEALRGKRVVLASASPRRRDILHTLGLEPEIVPSEFEENLTVTQFEDVHEYPVATAAHKAVEVYERLVSADPDDPPDLVIAADTVVLTHTHTDSQLAPSLLPTARQELLEKPEDEADNLRMLLDLNGAVCEVVTGVTLVYPILSSPGYEIKSIDERTLIHFADNPTELIHAYAKSGEGRDRAGGFAVQGLGSMLVRKIDGDWYNAVGFPAASFMTFLEKLVDEEPDFLQI